MDSEFLKVALWALQILGAGFCTILWFNFREVKTKGEKATSDLADYKLHVAETYVNKTELNTTLAAINKTLDAIFNKLDRVEGKLDSKQDKP